MSTASNQDPIEQTTRICQIIVGALVAGVLIFLGVAASVDLGIRRPIQPVGGGGQQAAGQDGKPDAIPGPDADANAAANPGGLLDAFVSGPFITYIAIAFAVVLLPLSFVLPRIIAAQSRRAIAAGKRSAPPQGFRPEAVATDTGQLAIVYQQQLIVGAAVNEGTAFFAAVAYLIEKSPLALGLAVLLVGGIILRFPTRRRVELWVDQQREKLELERQDRC